jgi:hypothetical protein
MVATCNTLGTYECVHTKIFKARNLKLGNNLADVEGCILKTQRFRIDQDCAIKPDRIFVHILEFYILRKRRNATN